MDIKELIQHLQCFDENHHVVIEITDNCISASLETDIAEVKFDGRNCVIRTELDG